MKNRKIRCVWCVERFAVLCNVKISFTSVIPFSLGG